MNLNIGQRVARGRNYGAVVLAFFGLIASGCAPYAPVPGDFRRPVATLASVARPIQGNGAHEMTTLGPGAADQLRRCWVLMETRQPMRAIHELNRVLQARPAPPREILALAHYLRSRAFQYRGDNQRALTDCRRARTLASGADLQRQCDVEIARLQPAAPAIAAPTPEAAGAGTLAIVPRHHWNAARPVGARLDPMQGIRRLTIHHSAVLSRNPNARAVAISIRSIQNYHMQDNRYGDIGYHFLIDPAGRVWEGRDLGYQGAHAGGVNNEHNIGICLLGNFVPGRQGQSPGAAQVDAMQRLVDWLGSRYAIPRQRVLTHQELKPGTACPGSRLQALVDKMRRELAMAPRERPRDTAGGTD